MASHLCSSCLACFEGTAQTFEAKGGQFAVHHATPNSFSTAVRQGCALCLEMWKHSNIADVCSEDLWKGWENRQRYQPFTRFDFSHFNTRLRAIYLRMIDDIPGPRLRSVHRVLVPQDDLSSSTAIDTTSAHEKAPSTTGDPSVVKQLAKWLEACKSHPQCSIHNRSYAPPTRLVDLDPLEGRHMFRVWSTAEQAEDQAVPYCTLSHCWGDGKGILKLEKRTMNDLYAGKRKTALPLTFREAMAVALELGVRHMWIDSLCIIQDDTSDWGSESQNMSHIYANATLNIAATANSHAHMRLFRQRTRDVTYPVLVDVRSVASAIQVGLYGLFDIQLWTSHVMDQPLNKRAWVFQERLLSPRTIHFTKDQVIWQCRSITATEAYPAGVLPALLRDSGQSLFERPSDVNLLVGEGHCQSVLSCDICRQWAMLVQRFSQGRLTFPDDRPVAVLGLAKEVAQLIHDPYVLGMFRGHLLRQLCWVDFGLRHTSIDGPARHPSRRHYPSFSWLSVDGEIRTSNWKCVYDKFFVELVEIRDRATVTTDDQLQQGCLVMRGSLIPVMLHREAKIKTNIEIVVSGMSAELSHSICHVHIDQSRREGPSMLQGAKHYLLPLAREIDYHNRPATAGLLIESVQDDSVAYRRIGLVEMAQPEPEHNEPGTEIETLMARHRVEADIILL